MAFALLCFVKSPLGVSTWTEDEIQHPMKHHKVEGTTATAESFKGSKVLASGHLRIDGFLSNLEFVEKQRAK
jgi:hypothetical protein